jgi:tetratricopeptide (TPR) repeat protein
MTALMSTHAASRLRNAGAAALSFAAGTLALLTYFSVSPTCAAQQRPAKAAAHFQQVELLIQQGHLDEAKTKMLAELRANPSSVEGNNLLGIIDASQQDYPDALAAFQKALTLAPNSTKTRNNLGNVYVATQKLDLAEKQFRAVLRLDPVNRDGNYNLGVLLMAKGTPSEAIPYLERVQPANIETSFNLIRALLQSERTAQAIRLATDLSAQHKDDVQVHFSLGVLLASEHQYKPAQLELERADALRPGTFEILYNLGQVLLRDGENSKAEIALTRALKLKPESPETLYLLAEVATNQSRPLDALDLLLRAHKIAPDNTDVILLMARVSMSQNYFEDSIPLLESGLRLAPQRADLRTALGESYFMSGKVDNAIEEFTKLVETEHSARSYSLLGLAYRELGRFDEARQYLQQGIKLDPRNSSCLFSLGYIAERQGDSATAEALFQQTLRSNPDFAEALLELANLKTVAGKFAEAEDLLRRYVHVSSNPATGYYKLAKVERSLHETDAADRDLKIFQTLSKNSSAGPYPFEHLFDYLDNRSKLAPSAREQLDLAELADQFRKHPDQPEDMYMLAEAYLKAGRADDARSTLARLDAISAGDYRTLTGVGALLARYRLYDDAIQHFQQALQVNSGSDEAKFDLANAYFRKRRYSEALDIANQVSSDGRKDDAYLALLGDIYTHLGDTAHSTEIFRAAIGRNPDDDQNYLALSLLEMRAGNIDGAKLILLKGQARIPGSGKLIWGLGLTSMLDGKTSEAADRFERAVDLLPEWPGSYSILGVFYYQTGQIGKAREVLDRFKSSNASSSLNADRIEQLLAQTPENSPAPSEPMTMENRSQLLQLALSLADRTL